LLSARVAQRTCFSNNAPLRGRQSVYSLGPIGDLVEVSLCKRYGIY